MAKRVRTTVTVREDNPVPRRRRKKKTDATVVVVIVLLILGLFWARMHRAGAPPVQRVTFSH